ncbi:MAG TPA: hypothetical protein VE999_11540 [Gemmataceae bacterium]|nr:hypothetical protein [Gemmataceae bacterium]
MVGLVLALWTKYPDWRLTQLVLNAHAAACEPGEAYFAEDDVIERGLRSLLGGPAGGGDGGERVPKAA